MINIDLITNYWHLSLKNIDTRHVDLSNILRISMKRIINSNLSIVILKHKEKRECDNEHLFSQLGPECDNEKLFGQLGSHYSTN